MAVLQHRLSRFARTLTIGVPCALSTAPALAQLGEAQAALSSLGGLMLVAVMLVLLAAVWLYKRQMHRMAERTRALALSEERFRVIVEGTNVVAWEYDIGADCFTYVSAPGEGLLGFQIEDWKQSGFWRSRLHPDDRDAAMAFLRRQLVADAPHDCEYRMRHADGHVIFVRDLRSPIAAGGHVMGMRGIFVDITAYKASEAALEDSEARFRSAYEQAAVGMALCAISGRFVRVNPRYCDITGYTEKELLERDFREITWREDVEGNDRLLDGLVIGNSAKTSMEKRIRRPDGSVVWVNLSIALVKPAQGGASHFMEVIEDITARRHAESELRESEGRMRSILSAMNEGVILRNAGGDVIVANGAARRIYGVAPGAALPPLHDAGTRYLREDGTTCPVEELPSFHAMHTGESRAGTVGIERGDGSRVWFVSRAEPLQRDSRTGLYPVVLTLNDVTGQRRAEEELRLAATVFDNSIEAIMITDAHRHILSVNRAFTDLTGYEPAQVLGNTPVLLAATSANDSAQYDDIWLRAAQAGAWQGETWQRRRDGSEFLEWLSVSAVYDPRGQITHFVAVFSDITERKASEARIAYLAHHDPLTELPNRTLFQDRLEQALARAERHHQRVALLFLDLDRFKTINDSLGHLAGDRLLQAVSGRLKDCVRTTDTICRQGGDEFIIVLADVGDPETPARVADKILRCLSEPFDIDGHRLGTSFSIGIAIYPDDGRSVDSLMKNADTAMYHAKENGRNTYRFFTEAMNANALERLHLESQLRQALERGELLLNYQPQVDLGTGAILGAEALIRWQSEALGFVPPGRFIPIAEESGLIVPIGRWVLRQACLHARTWQDAGLAPVGVAVNISALQFARDDIVTAVSEVLAETGLAPERLELELTESLLMHQGDEVLDTMHRLKALGVRLSIDDFGTGYSSLSYLKRFAVDRLKIDQGFVRDIADDPDDAAIVRAIIQLGRSLKLDVIAEGAEARAQVDFLLREGCRKAQGYFFCPPVTHDVFMSVLRRGLGARQNEHRALITH
ncbi:EAL domain-containing protein [Uliginosibacterium sp. sgz301328]|uniref:sensor domain-containing protein n=1 Tax=Uliginosibacterium sp. sgz301328 TaxID=3243764 RepID=UPI00359E917C